MSAGTGEGPHELSLSDDSAVEEIIHQYNQNFQAQFAQISDLASKHVSKSTFSYINGMITTAFAFAIKLWILDQIRSLYLLIFLALVGGSILIASKLGYLEKFSWLTSKQARMTKAIEVFDQMSTPVDNSSVSFSVNDTNQSASIVYARYGQKHIVNIPYNPLLRGKMSQYQVILLKNIPGNGSSILTSEVDISQQAGVPYMCTAEQLGGTKIIVKNKLSGEIVQTIDRGDIPFIEKTQ